jgi:hypothetical protein
LSTLAARRYVGPPTTDHLRGLSPSETSAILCFHGFPLCLVSRRIHNMIWDEWDDNVTDHEHSDQDSHVNFDFVSALSKPKVYASSSKLFFFFCWVTFPYNLFLFYCRITIRYWRWIMMLQTMPFDAITSA